jgi:uncharacterized membrane protein
VDSIILGIVWFIFLGFLPGFVLIGLLKLKDISWVEGLLYIIGLSLVFDMVVGFAINSIYPLFGIMPFNRLIMTVTWLGIVAILLIVVVIYRDELLKPYRWDNQWVTVGLLYIISVAIVYQTSLLTNNLVGSDIHLEYFYANQPVLNGFQDMSTYAYINICLPITILIPMYSVLSGLEVMWVFKAVQPLVLAILPVILYKIYKLQFGKTVAVLSTVFFITLPLFTMDAVQLIRQQYAMIFFALTTLVLIGRNTGMVTKIILGSIFGFGVAISHYGVGTGFMGYMVIGIVVISFFKIGWIHWLWGKVMRYNTPFDITDGKWKPIVVWIAIAIVSVGVGLLYYHNTGTGVGIQAAANKPMEIVKYTANTMVIVTPSKPAVVLDNVTVTPATSQTVEWSSDWQRSFDIAIREPLLRTAVGFDFGEASPLGKVWRILQYLVELCVLIGLVRLVIRPMPYLRTEFLVFIITSAFVVLGMYVLPTNGFGMGAVRVFVVTLIFLSPFFVLGVEVIAKWIIKLFKVEWKQSFLVGSTAIILIPYVLFNSGAVFELTKSTTIDRIDIPFSPALSGYRLDMTTYLTDEDIEAMAWLKDKMTKDYPIFGDWHSYQLVWQYVGEYNKTLGIEVFGDYGQGYVFLRKWNVDNQMLTTGSQYGCRKSIPWLEYGDKSMATILSKGVVVFDNGAKVIRVDK